jgi:hypothetical protein
LHPAACIGDESKVRFDAAAQNVRDLPAAEARLVEYERAPSARASEAEQYVELSEKVRSLENIAADGAAMILAAGPGNVGIHINHKSTDTAAIKKLKAKLRRLATALNIDFGEDWAPDSEEYKEGMELVRLRGIARFEEQAEAQVFKLSLIMQQLEQTEGGKNATKLRKSQAAAEA